MKHIMMILIAASFLGACGIKPGSVEGKPGHPATYPDIRHDPAPNGGAGATLAR